jgi:hypothetical protein
MSKMGEDQTGVLDRVKQALGVTSLQQVADALGEPLSTVKGWSARGSVPMHTLRRIKQIKKRSLDWLIDGPDGHESSPPKSATDGAFAPHQRDIGVALVTTNKLQESPPAAYAAARSATQSPDPVRLGVAIAAVQTGLRSVGIDPNSRQIGGAVSAMYQLLDSVNPEPTP